MSQTTSAAGRDAEPVFGSYAQMMRESDYARFEQEHRGGGSLGLELFLAHQGPMEMVDPPNRQIAFASVLRAEGPMEYDFNEGWRTAEMNMGGFALQPARTACAFQTRHDHTILVAGVDERRLLARLDEVGVRGDPFGPLYAATSDPHPEVVGLMRRVWAATEAQGPAANLLVDGLFEQALALVLRACDPARQNRAAARAGRPAPRARGGLRGGASGAADDHAGARGRGAHLALSLLARLSGRGGTNAARLRAGPPGGARAAAPGRPGRAAGPGRLCHGVRLAESSGVGVQIPCRRDAGCLPPRRDGLRRPTKKAEPAGPAGVRGARPGEEGARPADAGYSPSAAVWTASAVGWATTGQLMMMRVGRRPAT